MLRDTIRDDLATNRSLVETKQQGVSAATRSVELARETMELVRTQYEAGTVTQVDLLQAQDGLVGAQEALAQARFDLAVADLTPAQGRRHLPAASSSPVPSPRVAAACGEG